MTCLQLQQVIQKSTILFLGYMSYKLCPAGGMSVPNIKAGKSRLLCTNHDNCSVICIHLEWKMFTKCSLKKLQQINKILKFESQPLSNILRFYIKQ